MTHLSPRWSNTYVQSKYAWELEYVSILIIIMTKVQYLYNIFNVFAITVVLTTLQLYKNYITTIQELSHLIIVGIYIYTSTIYSPVVLPTDNEKYSNAL